MSNQLKKILSRSLCLLLIFVLVACNMNYVPTYKAYVTESKIRSEMPSVIDSQMETIDPYLDQDVRDAIHSSSRGTALSGREIVDNTLNESSGYNYLNFCYQVNQSNRFDDASGVVQAASSLLDEAAYEDLCNRIEDVSRNLEAEGQQFARSLPINQQKAFYEELKTLVVRTTVLLAAGVVYALIPTGVLWGKVSAAAAISVGAGLVAMCIMSLFEQYKFGTADTTESFEDWINRMLEQPKADYALAASALALGQTFEKGPVVAGIILCVFALFKAVDAARLIMLKYNFKV